MFLSQCTKSWTNYFFTHFSSMFDHILFSHDIDCCHGRCTRKRVARICKPSRKDSVIKSRSNRIGDNDASEWDITRVHTFCKDNEIRFGGVAAPVEAARTPKAQVWAKRFRTEAGRKERRTRRFSRWSGKSPGAVPGERSIP